METKFKITFKKRLTDEDKYINSRYVSSVLRKYCDNNGISIVKLAVLDSLSSYYSLSDLRHSKIIVRCNKEQFNSLLSFINDHWNELILICHCYEYANFQRVKIN